MCGWDLVVHIGDMRGGKKFFGISAVDFRSKLQTPGGADECGDQFDPTACAGKKQTDIGTLSSRTDSGVQWRMGSVRIGAGHQQTLNQVRFGHPDGGLAGNLIGSIYPSQQ